MNEFLFFTFSTQTETVSGRRNMIDVVDVNVASFLLWLLPTYVNAYSLVLWNPALDLEHQCIGRVYLCTAAAHLTDTHSHTHTQALWKVQVCPTLDANMRVSGWCRPRRQTSCWFASTSKAAAAAAAAPVFSFSSFNLQIFFHLKTLPPPAPAAAAVAPPKLSAK